MASTAKSSTPVRLVRDWLYKVKIYQYDDKDKSLQQAARIRQTVHKDRRRKMPGKFLPTAFTQELMTKSIPKLGLVTAFLRTGLFLVYFFLCVKERRLRCSGAVTQISFL